MNAVVDTRDAARRVVLELLTIGVVLVAGTQLPLHDVPGTSWAFLAPLVLFITHLLVGLVVLVEAVRIVGRSREVGIRASVWAGAGLAFCLLAVGAGATSLAGRGLDEVRPAMFLAGVGGLAVYGWLWWSSSAVLDRQP